MCVVRLSLDECRKAAAEWCGRGDVALVRRVDAITVAEAMKEVADPLKVRLMVKVVGLLCYALEWWYVWLVKIDVDVMVVRVRKRNREKAALLVLASDEPQSLKFDSSTSSDPHSELTRRGKKARRR